MKVSGIDHLVLYVTDVDRICDFYTHTLGLATVETSNQGRVALSLGSTSLKLNPVGDEYDPHASNPAPGSASFCLLVDEPIESVADRLRDAGVPLVDGPLSTIGATGSLQSVYVEDPDGNLVELAKYTE